MDRGNVPEGADISKLTKRCSTCKQQKVLADFNKARREKDGLRGRCNSCRHQYYLSRRKEIAEQHKQRHIEIARYQKRYAKGHRVTHAEKAKGYQLRYPQKCSARKQLQYAVKCGSIIKPNSCDNCSRKGSVEGHHEDYSRPFDVEWLCTKCHTEKRQKIKELV